MQREWIAWHVKVQERMQKKYSYTLSSSTDPLQTSLECKTMFPSTLGISSRQGNTVIKKRKPCWHPRRRRQRRENNSAKGKWAEGQCKGPLHDIPTQGKSLLWGHRKISVLVSRTQPGKKITKCTTEENANRCFFVALQEDIPQNGAQMSYLEEKQMWNVQDILSWDSEEKGRARSSIPSSHQRNDHSKRDKV